MARELPYAASVEAQYLAAVLEELEGMRADIASALAVPPASPAPIAVELREPAPAPTQEPLPIAKEPAPPAEPAPAPPAKPKPRTKARK